MRVEQFQLHHLAAVQALLELKYAAESSMTKRLTYSETATRNTLNYICSTEGVRGEVVMIDNIVAGFAAYTVDQIWFEECQAYIDMFFIHPEARASGASRLLVEACIKGCKSLGASVIDTGCESEINTLNDKLYRNLFAKFGFKEIGTALRYWPDGYL